MVASIPAILFVVWFVWFDGTHHLNALIDDVRTILYRTIATISATLIAFGLAVVALVYAAVSTKSLKVLVGSEQYPKLWITLFQTISGLGWLTIVSIVCLVFERGGPLSVWWIIPLIGLLGFVSVRMARTIWILKKVVTTSAKGMARK